MAKPIQLQQLATQMFITLKGFGEERYTGQVQFHVTMNQGGVSRAVLLTQSAFGYDRVLAEQPAPPPPPQPAPGEPPIAHKAPPIGLIATMSKKE